jgi:hypothetical protein
MSCFQQVMRAAMAPSVTCNHQYRFLHKESLEYKHHLATFKGIEYKFLTYPAKLVQWMNNMDMLNRVENREDGAFNVVV